MEYTKRIARLQKTLQRKGLDAILISQPHNRRYLSGFTAVDHDISESSGVLIIPASGEGYLLTDFRFELQAQRDVSHLKIKVYKKGLADCLKKFPAKLGLKTLAYESHYTLYNAAQEMKKGLARKKIEVVPLTGIVEKMRRVKDEEEIEAIRQAVQLNENVFEQIFPQISPKMSEIDIALLIERTMLQEGAERKSFDTIVASGDNSALPHAVPSMTRVVKNRPLTIDMGLVLHGYCADMTRTFVPGRASAEYKKLHRIVRKAQLAGIAAVRAGVSGKKVDQAARQVIAEAGYGQYFGHSLGHGVGLAVHEAPRVSKAGVQKLKEGMIITIEPGIYIPEWGGLRLEDMVVVRKNGCENLNRNTTWLDI